MKKTVLLILPLVFLVLSSGFVSASKVSIAPTITDMGACVMSFTNQLVRVTNVGTTTDTYRLNSDSNMVTFAGCTAGTVSNNELVLASGETAFCSVFINPLNNTEPQKHPITLNANSESSADTGSAKINVDVLRCNAVSITTQENLQVCAREKFSTPIIIKNTGKFSETFNISANAPVKFDDSKVMLSPGQSRIVNFEGYYEKVSNNTIKLVVKSENSFASAESKLDINVNECFNFVASMAQATGPMCMRKPAAFDLNIKNTGSKADVFVVDAGKSGISQISLNASQNGTVKISYDPEKEGRFRFNASVKSVGSDVSKAVYLDSEVKECAAVSLSAPVSTAAICNEEDFTYTIDVNNTGVYTESYDINATKGVLSVNKLTLQPGETKAVYLKVNTTGLQENKTNEMALTASAGSMKQSVKLLTTVSPCHAASMKIIPQSLTVCSPDKASFKVEINNNGRKPETFSVFAAGNKIADNLLIAKNATKSLEFVANYSNDTGIYRIDAEAVSDSLNIKSAGALVVKDYNTCYGAVLIAKDAKKDIKPSDRDLQELQLRNTGIKTLNYILQVVGPQWMAIGIGNITLEPNETGKVYLYLAPPFGTKIGNYSTTVIAISEKGVSSNADFTANVVGSTTTLKAVNTTTTLPPQAGGQRRTVVIGIILAIAAILILRYIFTSK
ncbi:MAG: hypothetical protein HY515_02165 [Candidatus Aenigmarchaeota archaeon]|nr:hypothetical protein [Candidatus Aenigmarchaeota archaeon]